jgi:S-formylglutathione hydrolase FrmB
MTSRTLCTSVSIAAVLLSPAAAREPDSPKGTVDVVTVHGASLEGNLTGDSPDRRVSVYLPASYATAMARRYPVVYLLHGFTDTDDRWFGRVQHFIDVPAVADAAIAAGTRDLIIVMPNAYTKFAGSMYSNSVVTGDWERFVAQDLVSYVDSHYRTLTNVSSRGLAGHSMGGYGVLRIGMKHPDVFSALYALSPCCMIPNMNPRPADGRQGRAGGRGADNGLTAEQIRTFADLEGASFGVKAQFASAAAWSPNPKNPPFFVDLPTRNGETNPLVIARWAANAPLALVDQYIGNLRKMKAIAIDAGDMDEPIATTIRTMHGIFDSYGVAHTFEIYGGNHVNRISERVARQVLPFFSTQLASPQASAR